MGEQSLLDKFYSTSNLVSVDIVLPKADWESLASADPRWGWRAEADRDQIKERRYDWYPTTSVTIQGKEFKGVAIIKKSFFGSFDKKKPSLKIDFSRIETITTAKQDGLHKKKVEQNAQDVRAFIGVEHLILNNCNQDDAYVRQPLGYEIFRQGKIPFARCNLAHVRVNGDSLGIYCNLEAIVSPYLSRNFNNTEGNLYETEDGYDLSSENFGKNGKKYDMNGFSSVKNQEDLKLACEQLDKGMADAKKVFDIPQIIRVLAMQAVVKHFDGYPNNTFFYNDTNPIVEHPKAENCRFKAIPSGIDRIYPLDKSKKYEVKTEGILSRLILADPESKAALQAAIKHCAGIFEKNLEDNLTLVKNLTKLVESVDVSKDPIKKERKMTMDDVLEEIKKLKLELKNCVQGVSTITL
ncbi:hypothetical protein E8E14_014803 [Neopestalotiopsis sp. 37M]|nr:hypothetical protein E8E14_014803 [Neopestalotiopsis sp. 37M]